MFSLSTNDLILKDDDDPDDDQQAPTLAATPSLPLSHTATTILSKRQSTTTGPLDYNKHHHFYNRKLNHTSQLFSLCCCLCFCLKNFLLKNKKQKQQPSNSNSKHSLASTPNASNKMLTQQLNNNSVNNSICQLSTENPPAENPHSSNSKGVRLLCELMVQNRREILRKIRLYLIGLLVAFTICVSFVLMTYLLRRTLNLVECFTL